MMQYRFKRRNLKLPLRNTLSKVKMATIPIIIEVETAMIPVAKYRGPSSYNF